MQPHSHIHWIYQIVNSESQSLPTYQSTISYYYYYTFNHTTKNKETKSIKTTKMVNFPKTVYQVQTPTAPKQDQNQQQQPEPATQTGETGSAGVMSVGEASTVFDSTSSGRRVGTGTGGVVTAPGYEAADTIEVVADTESQRGLSKEEADALYEERIEDEYAKREGGA